MVKHIVLFQLKDGIDPQVKQNVMEKFRSDILALPAKIPFIQHVEVGFCANPDEKYDIALYSEFSTLEEVNAYAVHPDHVAAASAIKPYVQSRACVDY